MYHPYNPLNSPPFPYNAIHLGSGFENLPQSPKTVSILEGVAMGAVGATLIGLLGAGIAIPVTIATAAVSKKDSDLPAYIAIALPVVGASAGFLGGLMSIGEPKGGSQG